jgi:uncharacterized protein (TIGR00369 family)
MTAPLLLDRDALLALMGASFPQAARAGFVVDAVDADGVSLSWDCGEPQLRPGGTVSGPTLFTLADMGAWLAILSRVGPETLAVTTGLEIHFLRKALPGVVACRARLLKLGKRLAVVSAELSQGDELVAVATVTYARPSTPG